MDPLLPDPPVANKTKSKGKQKGGDDVGALVAAIQSKVVGRSAAGLCEVSWCEDDCTGIEVCCCVKVIVWHLVLRACRVLRCKGCAGRMLCYWHIGCSIQGAGEHCFQSSAVWGGSLWPVFCVVSQGSSFGRNMAAWEAKWTAVAAEEEADSSRGVRGKSSSKRSSKKSADHQQQQQPDDEDDVAIAAEPSEEQFAAARARLATKGPQLHTDAGGDADDARKGRHSKAKVVKKAAAQPVLQEDDDEQGEGLDQKHKKIRRSGSTAKGKQNVK